MKRGWGASKQLVCRNYLFYITQLLTNPHGLSLHGTFTNTHMYFLPHYDKLIINNSILYYYYYLRISLYILLCYANGL